MQYLSVDDQDKLSSLPLLNKLAGRDHSVSYETTDTQRSLQSQEPPKGCKKLVGMLLMLLSVVCGDLARFMLKYAYASYPELTPIQQICGKFTMTLLLTAFAGLTSFKCRRVLCSIPRHMVCRFITRCFIYTAVNIFQGFGVKMLTYSTAVILSFIAPLGAPFTAFLLLREKITMCNILSLIICFGGVLIFTNPQLFGQVHETPGMQENSTLGILLMLASALCRSFDISYMKLLNKAQSIQSKYSLLSKRRFIVSFEENGDMHCTPLAYEVNNTSLDQLSVLFYLSLTAFSVGFVCLGAEQSIQPSEIALSQLSIWAILTGCAVLLILSQFFYSLATKYEDVGKLAAIFYFQIILAFVWEVTVFHGEIGMAQILGTTVIVVTSASVAVLKLMK